jgi:thioredoxin 1
VERPLAGNPPQEETMSDILQAVTDASFEVDVIEASKTQPVMVDFWADWCRPCHMLTPTVEEIAREHAGKVKVVKLNVDENMNVPGKFSIRGIPTLLVFKGGQVADQIVGAVPKEQIVKVLERHISS